MKNRNGWVEDGIGFIPLTQGKVARVSPEDVEWLSRWPWYAHLSKSGLFYATRAEYVDGKQKTVLMHREIVKPEEDQDVDHENHDTLDNQRGNVRPATGTQNNRNCRVSKKSSTGIKGVMFVSKRNKYQSSITVDNKKIWLGYFLTSEEASAAYTEASVKYHKEFSCLG